MITARILRAEKSSWHDNSARGDNLCCRHVDARRIRVPADSTGWTAKSMRYAVEVPVAEDDLNEQMNRMRGWARSSAVRTAQFSPVAIRQSASRPCHFQDRERGAGLHRRIPRLAARLIGSGSSDRVIPGRLRCPLGGGQIAGCPTMSLSHSIRSERLWNDPIVQLGFCGSRQLSCAASPNGCPTSPTSCAPWRSSWKQRPTI